MEKLQLDEDIYSLTFVNMVTKNTPNIHKELMLKSTLTFFLQLALITLIWWKVYWRNTDNVVFLGQRDEVVPLNAVRIICTIILHFTILPELESSLSLMRFVKSFVDLNEFGNGRFSPFLCAIMKFACGLVTEVLNILVII